MITSSFRKKLSNEALNWYGFPSLDTEQSSTWSCIHWCFTVSVSALST